VSGIVFAVRNGLRQRDARARPTAGARRQTGSCKKLSRRVERSPWGAALLLRALSKAKDLSPARRYNVYGLRNGVA